MGTVTEFHPKKGHLWVNGGDRYMFPHGVTSLAGSTRPHAAGELQAIHKFHKYWESSMASIYDLSVGVLPDVTDNFALRPDNFHSGSDAQASQAYADDWSRKPETQMLHENPQAVRSHAQGMVTALGRDKNVPTKQNPSSSQISAQIAGIHTELEKLGQQQQQTQATPNPNPQQQTQQTQPPQQTKQTQQQQPPTGGNLTSQQARQQHAEHLAKETLSQKLFGVSYHKLGKDEMTKIDDRYSKTVAGAGSAQKAHRQIARSKNIK